MIRKARKDKPFPMPAKILYIQGVTEIGGAETDLLAIIKGLDRKNFTVLSI